MEILGGMKTFGMQIERTCTGEGNGGEGCGQKLLVNEHDIFLTYEGDFGKKRHSFTFKCPICGKDNDIPSRDIPLSIAGKIRENKCRNAVRK